jgi:hypothetical protein
MSSVPESNQWACVVRGLVCLGYVPGAPAYFVAKAGRALCARLKCEHCGRVGPSYRPWRHPRRRACYRPYAVCPCGHVMEL